MAEPDAKQAAQPAPPGEQSAVAPGQQRPSAGGVGESANRIIEAESDDDMPAAPPAASAPAAATTVGSGAKVVDLKRIHSIKVLVQAVLGGINMSVAQLSQLKEGEVIPLDAKIGDPIEVLTNGQLMARGEIVVIEGPEPCFGIQITSLEPQGGTNL